MGFDRVHLLEITSWLVGVVLAVIAGPWLAFGVAVLYFKLRRFDGQWAWFDVPAIAVLIASVYAINITTVLVGTAFHRVTGVDILPAPPHWRGPRRAESAE
jgi:hypothetical protein